MAHNRITSPINGGYESEKICNRRFFVIAASVSMPNIRSIKAGRNDGFSESRVSHYREGIYLDGMSLMDDVGGIHGYIDFIKTIHGKDEDEKEEMREWAKWMG